MTFGNAQGTSKPSLASIKKPPTNGQGGHRRAINFFDTADAYSDGVSEKTLGQSFKNLNSARKDTVLATKVYSRVGPGPDDMAASRGHIMDAVEASLRRFQTDYIDLYQIHVNDSITPR